MDREWILITILIAFIVGAGLIACGTGLEWIRLTKLLDTTPERLISLLVVILGALIILIAYLVQLYLVLHHDLTIYHLSRGKSEIISD